MGLEQILDIAYKATFPIRAADKTIKLGYDALAAATSRAGFDRFTLAQYAGNGAAIGFFLQAIDHGMSNNFGYAAFNGIVALSFLSFANKMPQQMRTYFSKPKDIKNLDLEIYLQLCRVPRLSVIGLLLLDALGVLPDLHLPDNTNLLGEIGGIGATLTGMSYFYLIDGDHSSWDKATEVTKKVFTSLTSLLPHRTPSPFPSPGLSASYNATLANV